MDSEMVFINMCQLLRQYKSSTIVLHKEAIRRKLASIYVLYEFVREKEKKSKHQRLWVRDLFTVERRLAQGASNNLIQEMLQNDTEKFENYFRMVPELFEQLYQFVGPIIEKQTVVRIPISARTRLEICLRYLTSRDSMISISYTFRAAHNTISKIIAEICEAIWTTLKDQVFLQPSEENWQIVANEFKQKCHFPNCIGTVDGKHVVIQAPPNSGSAYYNYKGTHSLNLMAISNAQYQIILLDIGAEGRHSDGGVFRNTEMYERLESNTFSLPPPRAVEPGVELPFVLVADEAFPLTTYMMRPYPRSGRLDRSKKVFNYRLSKARKFIENAFGILASRFRIYRRPIIASTSTVVRIIQATVCLHNFILKYEATLPRNQRLYQMLSAQERNLPSDGL